MLADMVPFGIIYFEKSPTACRDGWTNPGLALGRVAYFARNVAMRTSIGRAGEPDLVFRLNFLSCTATWIMVLIRFYGADEDLFGGNAIR
jgi:hypothetical protein